MESPSPTASLSAPCASGSTNPNVPTTRPCAWYLARTLHGFNSQVRKICFGWPSKSLPLLQQSVQRAARARSQRKQPEQKKQGMHQCVIDTMHAAYKPACHAGPSAGKQAAATVGEQPHVCRNALLLPG